jgi:hypothetical protein
MEKTGTNMKITKRQLKRIIKEEKARIREQSNPAAAGMRAARHEGRVDYGFLAERIDEAATALEQLLYDSENALILNDQKSLADDLEKLINDAFQMAVTFDSLSKNQG